jgi:hypothetical protein
VGLQGHEEVVVVVEVAVVEAREEAWEVQEEMQEVQEEAWEGHPDRRRQGTREEAQGMGSPGMGAEGTREGMGGMRGGAGEVTEVQEKSWRCRRNCGRHGKCRRCGDGRGDGSVQEAKDGWCGQGRRRHRRRQRQRWRQKMIKWVRKC